MLIAQISDLHITIPGRKTYNIAPMAENLSRCIDHINQLAPRPDLVMVSGDICDIGTVEEAEHAAGILDRLTIPYYVIPGNHDTRDNLWKVFSGKACPSREGEFISYVIDDGLEYRLIAVDSTIPGAPGGALCARRLTWLDEQLAVDKNRPTLIFMHHPPVHCGVRETDIDGFAGADKLAAIVQKYDNIRRIACGHIHLLTSIAWHGTLITTAPSMGLQLHLDLTQNSSSQFVLEDPGFLLHHCVRNIDLVTHAVYVRDVDGPYSFEDQSVKFQPRN